MFTGLIEATGRLIRRDVEGEAGTLVLRTALASEMAHGDSLAVNGCCLTVESIDSASEALTFHVLSQTLRVTNLGEVPLDSLVNLERALQVGDRLGGHMVAGHVDTTAELLDVRQVKDDWVLRIALPEAMRPFAIDKGSIAVDGISLTIADLLDDAFEVHIIPVTWSLTNLHAATPGQRVNLEMDMVGKYILRAEALKRL